MSRAYDHAWAFLHKWEGDLVDHPADPGGITRHGVSLRFLKTIRPDATAQTIRDLTEAEAKEIARDHFWRPVQADSLPPGLALLTFDMAYNAGPGRSVRFLQQAVGAVADGRIGPVTIGLAKQADQRAACLEFTARRNVYYGSLNTFKTFGLGWMRRSADALAEALGLARPDTRELLLQRGEEVRRTFEE